MSVLEVRGSHRPKARTLFWTEGEIGYVKMFSERHGEVVAMVDASRIEELRGRGWFVTKDGKYAADAKGLTMHRYLFHDCPGNMQRDHFNGNGLDNRACNIRIVTRRDNCFNRRERKYKPGVNKHPRTEKFSAILRVGVYDTEDEAHEAWRHAYKTHYGTLPESVE